MKFLIDMNLSPLLVTLLENHGFNAVHWSTIGDPRETDRNIMEWAIENGYTVVTNDLDFGHILAATRRNCPSVIQFRVQDISPYRIILYLVEVLKQYKSYIEDGSLITIDETRSRIKILLI